MAEIAMYRCSNQKCRFEVRLTHGAPVWHQDAPKHVRSLSVSEHARNYVVRYRSESLCATCFKIAETTRNNTCPHCESKNIREEQTGHMCPRCQRGTFNLDLLLVH